MKKRVITTSSGTVTLGQYVKAWRAVKEAPAATEFKSSLCGWWPASREEILSQFMQGVHDRINRRIPGYGEGRKWDQDWQRTTQNFARSVNTPRLVVRWAPKEFQERLAHRIAGPDDA